MCDHYQQDQSYPIDNYFNLPHVAQLNCHIESYSSKLSNLRIGIGAFDIEGQDYYYEAIFSGVCMVVAPTEWSSANFQLASPEVSLESLRNILKFDDLDDEYLLWYYKLYVVKLARMEVRILASSVSLLTSEQVQQNK